MEKKKKAKKTQHEKLPLKYGMHESVVAKADAMGAVTRLASVKDVIFELLRCPLDDVVFVSIDEEGNFFKPICEVHSSKGHAEPNTNQGYEEFPEDKGLPDNVTIIWPHG